MVYIWHLCMCYYHRWERPARKMASKKASAAKKGVSRAAAASRNDDDRSNSGNSSGRDDNERDVANNDSKRSTTKRARDDGSDGGDHSDESDDDAHRSKLYKKKNITTKKKPRWRGYADSYDPHATVTLTDDDQTKKVMTEFVYPSRQKKKIQDEIKNDCSIKCMKMEKWIRDEEYDAYAKRVQTLYNTLKRQSVRHINQCSFAVCH